LAPPATIGAVETGSARQWTGAWTLDRVRATFDWRYLAIGLGFAWLAYILLTHPMPLYDARAYWLADWNDPYAISGEGETNAYLYSPAFLQLIAPLRALPYEWFGWAWVVITAATLVLITRHWLFVALLIPLTMIELEVGNIHFLLAAAVYAGMRYPAAWAFVLLTKVTPGIGLIWFAVRREWRNLAIAGGATAAIVALSFATSPSNWIEWIESLVGNAHQQWPYPLFPVPLAVRLAAAAGLIAWGAHTDRRWTMIVGTTLAVPTLWPANAAMIIGLPLFVDRMRRR
jgi:Glycosyltransferase family 87